jgi:hypothetical protein
MEKKQSSLILGGRNENTHAALSAENKLGLNFGK